MRTAKTLIRLGGCSGWSESSLGAHVILLFLLCCGSNLLFCYFSAWESCRLKKQLVYLYEMKYILISKVRCIFIVLWSDLKQMGQKRDVLGVIKLSNKILYSLGYWLMLLKMIIGEKFYLFSGRQNDSMLIFSPKFVVKFAAKILKIGWQIKIVQKYFWIRIFVLENSKKK